MTLLESLKKYTIVVADTGDIDAIARHRPQDATTNPSLLFHAAQMPAYKHLVDEATGIALQRGGPYDAMAEQFIDQLFVLFGCEILKIVPGRVSTEVDAGLSFDTEGTIAKARRLIGLYEKRRVRPRTRPDQDRQHLGGHSRGRDASRSEGIHCNLTLLFSFAQAVACAEARVTLISPFVGRIYDWYKKDKGVLRHPRRRGSRRGVGDAHLQLLQEVRLQDAGHGRELPQGRADRSPRRLRPADDQPRPAREAGADRRAR